MPVLTGLDYDLLVLESLAEYHQSIRKRHEVSSVFQMMDQAVTRYVSLKAREANTQFVECQHWQVENSRTLLHAFSDKRSSDEVHSLILLWMTLHEHISLRHDQRHGGLLPARPPTTRLAT